MIVANSNRAVVAGSLPPPDPFLWCLLILFILMCAGMSTASYAKAPASMVQATANNAAQTVASAAANTGGFFDKPFFKADSDSDGRPDMKGLAALVGSGFLAVVAGSYVLGKRRTRQVKQFVQRPWNYVSGRRSRRRYSSRARYGYRGRRRY